MDRLSALRLFIRTVETGSFSRAGRDAGLSQSATSRAIAALEVDLGARLLLRTTRRLSVTEAGQRVYEQALRMLDEDAALMEAAAGADREPVGRLRVSTSVAFATDEVAPHVGGFLRAFPRVRLDLAATDARVDAVAEGVDLILRLGSLADSGMTGRRLGAYQPWLVASPGVAEGLDARASIEDQLRGRCIVYSGSTLGMRWRLDGPGDPVVFEASGPLTAGAGAVVHGLAVAGVGVALLPSFAVRADLASGRLVRVAPEWSGPSIDLSALWSHRALPRKGRVFLDYLSPLLTLDDR
ncbi:LysR family transcriptional regulator [Brevundimonas sp. AJA228-03]|uniref:LysR family transcriptional regulator n=1 Tax=Brevundimonas sp. AJA228-03 TaxID=2752515 RepID=UPI001ADF4F12|nr:LysR family transcriptional regulator [Brevundimonas sp. AJA228-03]QTN18455.1 LysR family transcriptional regulator [Brevundimonas sp. AJA228-03]